MAHEELNQRLANSIRVHRRNSGISQGELGFALGYRDEETVARHERFETTPPLAVALGYEIVFRIPVTELFAALRKEVETRVEAGLMELETTLGERSARDRDALATARKLSFLSLRKDPHYRLRA